MMSIATEITRLQNAKAAIKTAIENKGVTVGDGLIDTYAEKIDEIQTGGSDNYYDTFWDSQQNNGKRTGYEYGFYDWKNGTIRPKYNVAPKGSAARMFYLATDNLGLPEIAELCGMTFDFSNCTNFSYMFGYCNIPDVGYIDVRKVTDPNGMTQMFLGVNNTHTVHLRIKDDGTTPFTGVFNYAYGFENVTFEGVLGNSLSMQWSSKLTRESIYNILSVLSDTTTGKTFTVNKTAVDKAFETSEGANDGSTSDEWNTLVATKPNWTISLKT